MVEPGAEARITVDRPLTDEELTLTRWILENGKPEGAAFLNQLERARVVGHCPCGCASIGFAIEGMPIAPSGVHMLGEFVYGNETNLAVVFAFSCDGILSGLEVYGLDIDAPNVLPNPSELRPFGRS